MFVLLLISVTVFECVNGANILILHPMDFKSQVVYLRPLASALAQRNHRVTVVSGDENGFDRNKMEVILTHNLSYTPFVWDKAYNFLQEMAYIQQFGDTNMRIFLSSSPVRDLIASNRKFDAVIANTIYFQPLTSITHRFKAVAIDFVPQAEHLYTSVFTGNLIRTDAGCHPDKSRIQNFFQRAKNTWKAAILLLYLEFVIIPGNQKIMDDLCRFEGYENRPPLKQLLFNKSVFFVNGHPTLSTSNYVSIIQKDVAGISIEPHSSVPHVYEKFISKSKSGFILLSWGSVLSSSDGAVGDAILDALSRLPYRVIWKISKSNFSKKVPDNVFLSSWVPQSALLGDERVKLFWTHGGYNSMIEAVNYGIPVVVTPTAFDQPKNAAFMIERSMGLMLPFENFTVDSLVWTINEVIKNPKYKEGANKLSRAFKARPLPPMDETIFWIEHAINFKSVIDMANNHAIFIFLWRNVDVFIVTFLLLLSSLLCAILLLKFFYRQILYKTEPLKKMKRH